MSLLSSPTFSVFRFVRFPFCALPEFSSVMHGCEGESGGAVAARSAEAGRGERDELCVLNL
jgi:hypothetical protein